MHSFRIGFHFRKPSSDFHFNSLTFLHISFHFLFCISLLLLSFHTFHSLGLVSLTSIHFPPKILFIPLILSSFDLIFSLYQFSSNFSSISTQIQLIISYSHLQSWLIFTLSFNTYHNSIISFSGFTLIIASLLNLILIQFISENDETNEGLTTKELIFGEIQKYIYILSMLIQFFGALCVSFLCLYPINHEFESIESTNSIEFIINHSFVALFLISTSISEFLQCLIPIIYQYIHKNAYHNT